MSEAAAAPSSPLVPFRLRALARGEANFVAGTWLRSYLSSPWARRLDQADYFEAHSRIVNAIIPAAVVRVAEHAEQPGLLLGYAVGRKLERPTVDYVYVKGDYRRLRIATALVEDLLRAIGSQRVVYTHAKAPATEAANRRGWHHNPYPALCVTPAKERAT